LGRAVNTPVYNNGLVLNLDAGNANSYPGTGTTWFDLASGNNGTLTNSPTYGSTNGGSISFDGVNDYVDLGSNIRFNDSDLTYDFWVKFNDNANSYRNLITQANPLYNGYIQLSKSRSGYLSGKVYFDFNGNYVLDTLDGSALPTAGVLNYTAVLKKVSGSVYVPYLYRNGVLVSQHTNPTQATYNMNNWSSFQTRIGDGTSVYPANMSGDIYIARIYNRALTATEILNNFNATRGRFGL
jgi:hypothetical protein